MEYLSIMGWISVKRLTDDQVMAKCTAGLYTGVSEGTGQIWN